MLRYTCKKTLLENVTTQAGQFVDLVYTCNLWDRSIMGYLSFCRQCDIQLGCYVMLVISAGIVHDYGLGGDNTPAFSKSQQRDKACHISQHQVGRHCNLTPAILPPLPF